MGRVDGSGVGRDVRLLVVLEQTELGVERVDQLGEVGDRPGSELVVPRALDRAEGQDDLGQGERPRAQGFGAHEEQPVRLHAPLHLDEVVQMRVLEEPGHQVVPVAGGHENCLDGHGRAVLGEQDPRIDERQRVAGAHTIEQLLEDARCRCSKQLDEVQLLRAVQPVVLDRQQRLVLLVYVRQLLSVEQLLRGLLCALGAVKLVDRIVVAVFGLPGSRDDAQVVVTGVLLRAGQGFALEACCLLHPLAHRRLALGELLSATPLDALLLLRPPDGDQADHDDRPDERPEEGTSPYCVHFRTILSCWRWGSENI